MNALHELSVKLLFKWSNNFVLLSYWILSEELEDEDSLSFKPELLEEDVLEEEVLEDIFIELDELLVELEVELLVLEFDDEVLELEDELEVLELEDELDSDDELDVLFNKVLDDELE